MSNRLIHFAAACAILVAGTAFAADAPPTGIRRTELQRSPVPGGKYVAVLIQVDIDAGAKLPMHTHPGVESTYVVSGMLTLSVKGQADRILGPGESYMVPAGTPHSAVSGGPSAFKGIASYVIEADKPLSTPVP